MKFEKIQIMIVGREGFTVYRDVCKRINVSYSGKRVDLQITKRAS